MTEPLRVVVWPGMPDPEALERAAASLGRQLEARVVAANEDLERLVERGPPFDLITPSDYMVERLAARGALHPLDRDRLPRLADLAGWAREAPYDPEGGWSVPFAFGTTGVLYDRERLGERASWSLLFDPPEGVAVGLLDEVREVVGAALIAGGEPPGSTVPAALERAAARLRAAAPSVRSVTSEDFATPVLERRVAAHHAWSGPAAMAVRRDRSLAYALPEEGALMWVTTAAIPAGAPDPGLSHALLAALMEPELAALQVARGGYPTPNLAAVRVVPGELAADPVLFPPPEVLERCHTVRDVGPEGEAAMAAAMRSGLSGARSSGAP